MEKKNKKLVTEYARMWPREIFDVIASRKEAFVQVKRLLNHPGVYVLYRNDQTYYIGKANRLFSRLWRHAMNPRMRLFNFWTHFFHVSGD